MRLLLLPRWARRLVTVPAMFLLMVWLIGLLPLWLIAVAFAVRFVPGRWRAFRLLWFAVLWVALEIVVLTALFGLWLASGLGLRIRAARSLRSHHALLAWFLRRLVGTTRRTFGLDIVIDDESTARAPIDRPLLVFSRHAGAGDSLLLVDGLVNGPVARRPIIVLKDVLQLDPVIDVMLNRIGASFVPSRGRAGPDTVAEIGRLAAAAGPGDALVIFPEGGNFTEGRRERAIAQLEARGRDELALRARDLANLLPPEPGGVRAAITAAPDAHVVFVGHVGLEALSSLRDIWRRVPITHDVVVRTWHWAPEDLPGPDDLEQWLYDQWEHIDSWIDEHLGGDGIVSAEP